MATELDPLLNLECDVRFVQPFQATKVYLCPGCGRNIPERTGHYVSVPIGSPDLRRHWHKVCWEDRFKRPHRH